MEIQKQPRPLVRQDVSIFKENSLSLFSFGYRTKIAPVVAASLGSRFCLLLCPEDQDPRKNNVTNDDI